MTTKSFLLGCCLLAAFAISRDASTEPTKNEAVASRAKAYYAALENQDFEDVWDFLAARMREEHVSREKYALKLAKEYPKFKVLNYPVPAEITWESSGQGDAKILAAKVRAVVKVRRVDLADLVLVHSTYWTQEPALDSKTAPDWFMALEEMKPSPQTTSIERK